MSKKVWSAPRGYAPPKADERLREALGPALETTLLQVRALCRDSADLIIHRVRVGRCRCALLLCEGLVAGSDLPRYLIEPLLSEANLSKSPRELARWVREESVLAPEQVELARYGELFTRMMSGFVILLIDAVPGATALGMQGFAHRSAGEASSEENLRAAREGFIEPLRPNLGMLRRRVKSPDLRFELLTVGVTSNTDVCLVYRQDVADPALVEGVRRQLGGIQLDTVLEGGYLQPFLEGETRSLFSGVGTTERPDVLCAKVGEGRVGVLVDGSPFAMVLPFLFCEHFQSIDDYTHRPYFATLLRTLKYTAFVLSILLPGVYVALVRFHMHFFPGNLLYTIALAQEQIALPVTVEALLLYLIYEVVREAGLRLPRSIGHAVSILGGLVIGDAAVSARIVGAPVVLIVALTALCSYVVPTLYQPITLLRLVFILVGGAWGLPGVTVCLAVVLLNLCSVEVFGVPVTSPGSPASLFAQRDLLLRVSWRWLGREDMRVQGLPGSDLAQEGGREWEDR